MKHGCFTICRKFSLALAILALAGCSYFAPRVELQRLTLDVAARANDDSPIAVDFVAVKDAELFKELAGLPASQWFANREQYRRDYRQQFAVWSLELVPGQFIESESFPLRGDRATGLWSSPAITHRRAPLAPRPAAARLAASGYPGNATGQRSRHALAEGQASDRRARQRRTSKGSRMSVLPDAVCWHEGMQLLPQHFQLQGLRAEALAARTGQACNPWFWGVTALELDPSALCAGQVRVLHLEAILPDGLPVSVQAGVDAPLEFDLETALAAAEGPLLNVHLAVSPLWRAGQLLPLKGRLQSRVGAPLPDLASGEHPEPITVWRASLRLVGDDGKADSVCLPLLRVAKEGGAYVSLPYVPPTPLVLPESPLGRRVQSLCARAREKALFLGGRLRLAQQAGNQDDAVEVRRQLAALWTRLPEVEGLLASRAASPLALHGSLLGLAGAWAALDPLAGVPAFEALDFLDLRRGYEPLLDWLERAIESIRAGYRCLPFEQEEQVFSVRLPDPAPRQRLVVGLRMPAGAGEQAAADWLERAIVASDPHLPLLARQRMSGLARQPMNRQEQVAYSVGDDTRLFVVQGAGDWFDAGQPLRIVAPVSGVASSPWQIVLFVADGSDNT